MIEAMFTMEPRFAGSMMRNASRVATNAESTLIAKSRRNASTLRSAIAP